jgi:hypothetical protein
MLALAHGVRPRSDVTLVGNFHICATGGFSSMARRLGARSRDNLYESELQPYRTRSNEVPRSGLCITPSISTTFFYGIDKWYPLL